PDDQLDVVAPDVHMRSPACVFFVVFFVLALRCARCGLSAISGTAPSDWPKRPEVAVCKRTDTEFHPGV
ncbi:hypothetical protein, partial [Nocardia sp. NPDC003354]